MNTKNLPWTSANKGERTNENKLCLWKSKFHALNNSHEPYDQVLIICINFKHSLSANSTLYHLPPQCLL